MKFYIVLLLVIGASIGNATTALKETVTEKTLKAEVDETITSGGKISIGNKNERIGDELNDASDKGPTNYEEPLDKILENIENPTNEVLLEESVSFNEFNLQDPSDANYDEMIPATDNDFNYSDIINRDPNEIMDTAAGFVPIPIFKRRQKPRKQVATRRRFKPYPYRRRYYYYPYYYSYYRPSSLRFYY